MQSNINPVQPQSTEAAAKPVTLPLKNSMPALAQGPDLAAAMDYRKYLAEYYDYRREISKKDLRPYNYSVFSAAADIKSPNYLKMIIDGKRNLSGDMISKFGKALGLNKEQTDQFRVLVNFNQATDPAERNFHLKELTEIRVNAQLKSGAIDQKTWDKVPNWVAWVLYSMIDQRDVNFSSEQLRTSLRAKASFHEIEEAINTLIKSGEVTRSEDGLLQKSHNLIESPDDVPVALVRKLQAQLMYLGLESLYQDSATEREFGSLTMALTKDEFEQIKFQLRKMRKELHKENSIQRMNSKGDRVYQLNLQLFPVSDEI